MYNYYPQQQYAGVQYMTPQASPTQYQAPPPQLKGRPVSSVEEARAAQIDFDGSVFVFPDISNKRIYTKCINMDGTSSLNTFELVETPPAPSSDNYVTKEEFLKTIEELKQSLTPSAPPKPEIRF